MTNTYLASLGFLPVVRRGLDTPDGLYLAVNDYLAQNNEKAANGDTLYLSIGIDTSKGHLYTEEHTTNTRQFVGDFTTKEPQEFEALIELFYANRGGRGEKIY